MSDFYFGIDLGTTNSVIAVCSSDKKDENVPGKVKVLDTKRITGLAYNAKAPEISSKSTLPSCVFYREKMNGGGYDPIVGEFAKSQYEIRPDFVSKSVKSQMGNPTLSNLSDLIPDKTPEDVSARILEAMITSIKKTMNYDIHDAIITVPASFGSTQSEATLRAAQKAGICTVNPDGSKREILLSEPKAVIYNLINEMSDNPLISDFMLNMDRTLNMLVFDIGGGTLDITLHKVERSEKNSNHYTIHDISTNGHTLFAGDNFDRAIAEEMFKRYLSKVMSEARGEITANKEYYILKLMATAEILKMDLNSAVSDEGLDSLWDYGEEDIEDKLFDVSGLTKDKYAYYDSFKKCEVEEILESFMGNEFSYEDFPRAEEIAKANKTENIIYPILEVLKKASVTLGTEDFKVDAVILNGGMSKFYMIKNRIKEFFGMEPLTVTDPDLSVARGAAIYRFYQRNEMPLVKEASPRKLDETIHRPTVYNPPPVRRVVPPSRDEFVSGIYSGVVRNNQSLYISATYGNQIPIIEDGVELPYFSPRMPGFIIYKNQDTITIPICERDNKGNFQTIAVGVGKCKKYPYETYVSVVFSLNRNKILTFDGQRSSDKEGRSLLEDISIKINFNRNISAKGNRLFVPEGSRLDVDNMMTSFVQLLKNSKNDTDKIKNLRNQISKCGNKADFAEPILDELERCREENVRYNLVLIAKRMSPEWSENDKKRLRKYCASMIKSYYNWRDIKPITGNAVTTLTLMIYTLSILGTDTIPDKLNEIKEIEKFIQPCMHLFAKNQLNSSWVIKQFNKSLKNNKGIAQTVWAMGVIMRRTDNVITFNDKEIKDVVDSIIKIIESNPNQNVMNVSVMALGLICDQRSIAREIVPPYIAESVYEIIRKHENMISATPSYSTARKMLLGEQLNASDEQYLLGYLYAEELN